MKRNQMIKSNREISEIIKAKDYLKNSNFVIYKRSSKYSYSHFAIAVSKKLGNAVIRNKVKRRMRNIIDNNKNKLRNNYDYIIIMKENSSKINFQQLEQSFLELIKKEGTK